MANMSYCRFRNTLNDLQDCFNNFDDNDLDLSESNARRELYILCCNIVKSYDLEDIDQINED